MTDAEAIETVALLDRHIAALMEHFDSVQILATAHDPDPVDGGTRSFHRGAGNWYARQGLAREWVLRQDAMADQKQRDEMDDD